MLKRTGNGTSFVARGTYIHIRDLGTHWGGREHKTNLYEVIGEADVNFVLGKISWFGRWRKYVFSPGADTVYEETCMRDIAQFVEEETKAHRAKRRA